MSHRAREREREGEWGKNEILHEKWFKLINILGKGCGPKQALWWSQWHKQSRSKEARALNHTEMPALIHLSTQVNKTGIHSPTINHTAACQVEKCVKIRLIVTHMVTKIHYRVENRWAGERWLWHMSHDVAARSHWALSKAHAIINLMHQGELKIWARQADTPHFAEICTWFGAPSIILVVHQLLMLLVCPLYRACDVRTHTAIHLQAKKCPHTP